MASNKRDLKAYVRYDGSGRVVASSLILRRQKPKVGKWKEIQGYQCCNQNQARVEVQINGNFPYSFASIEVGPDNGNWYQPITSYSNTSAANIDELAAVYNTNFPNLGSFTVEDGNLIWYPSATIAAFYTANKTTVLYAVSFED